MALHDQDLRKCCPADLLFIEVPDGIPMRRKPTACRVGIPRADDADLLAAAGADLTVATLDDDTASLAEGRLAARKA